MKSLHTLLKLAKRDLETLRRAMAAEIARQTAVEDRIAGHAQALIAEQRAAQTDYESARAYGGYAVRAMREARALESERDAIGEAIEALREQIAEAHVEARKFERLIELEAARAKKARDRREAAELDEMATLRAGRMRSSNT